MTAARRPLLLVTASGLAREALAVLRGSANYEIVGILDDDHLLHGRSVDGVTVVGDLDAVERYPDAALLVCPGSGAVRSSIVERLGMVGVERDRYIIALHPSVDIPGSSRVGAGSVLLAGVVLTTAVTIGDHVVAMPHVTLTHDVVVDDYATLAAGVSLGGHVSIGRGAYVGMHAAVRERARIGPGATIGMGAVVLSDVPAGQTWAGVPARRLVVRARRVPPPARPVGGGGQS